MRLLATLPALAVLGLVLGADADDVRLDYDGNPVLEGTDDAGEDGELPGDAEGSGPGWTVYSDRTAFLAAAGTLSLEDFEDEPLSGTCGGGGLMFLSFPDFSVSSDRDALKVLGEECHGNGNHNTTPGGSRYLSSDTDVANRTGDMMIVLNAPASAFGTWLIDLDGATMGVSISDQMWAIPPNGDGGETFFGVISSTELFTTISIADVDSSDSHYSLDDISYGTTGPVSVHPRSWTDVKGAHR